MESINNVLNVILPYVYMLSIHLKDAFYLFFSSKDAFYLVFFVKTLPYSLDIHKNVFSSKHYLMYI